MKQQQQAVALLDANTLLPTSPPIIITSPPIVLDRFPDISDIDTTQYGDAYRAAYDDIMANYTCEPKNGTEVINTTTAAPGNSRGTILGQCPQMRDNNTE